MIIYRAFYREASQTTVAIAAVLLIIFLLSGITVLLGQAARGDYPDKIILTLLGLQALKKVDLLLPLSLYFGVLLTLSRWYRDSEMTVLAACGVGLARLLRPVLVLTLVLASAVGLLSFYFTPLAARSIERVKNESAQRPTISGIVPGTFTEVAKGSRIFYIESIDPKDRQFEKIFASGREEGGTTVLVAESGHPYTDRATGEKFIALRNGTIYKGVPGQADYRVLDFTTYAIRVEEEEAKTVLPPRRVEGMSTRQLLSGSAPQLSAEWHWRLSKPITVFVLPIFALVLAYTDARRGRLANLFAAILVYFIYSNLLGMGQTFIKKAQLPPEAGLWWVHGGFILIGAYLLWRRLRNRPLLPLPGRLGR